MSDSFQSPDHTGSPEGQQGQGQSFGDGSADKAQSQATNNVQLSSEDIQALVKKAQHADQHIATLEQENLEYRGKINSIEEKLTAMPDVDSIMERLQKQELGVDADDLVQQVTQNIQSSMQADVVQQTQDQNFQAVKDALGAKHGDKADEAVKKACEDSGMSWENMVDLARSNPKAALKLCEVDVYTAPAATSTGYNTQGFKQEPEHKPFNADMLRQSEKAMTEEYIRRLDAITK